MIKNSAVFISVLLLTGCVSNNFAVPVNPVLSSKPLNLSSPELGVVSISELGDFILSHEVGKLQVLEVKEITTLDTLQRSLITKTPELPAGSVGGHFKGSKGEFAACFPGRVCMFDADNNGRFESLTHPDSLVTLSTDIGYSVSTDTKEQITQDYFKQTITYQGFANGNLRFRYREFADKTARPAFDQEFEIEKNLSGPTMFGFKGARFEVLEADNIQIKFKVTAYFNR